ncbi:MAG: alpha/beta fold hydrolase [Gemmatimonadaceae bacterium]
MPFPSGDPKYTERSLVLRSGLRVRTVESVGELAPAPLVLLLPGWGCSAYSYRHALPALAAAGFRAVAAELKGAGFSDKPSSPSEYTRESLVAQVMDIIDELGADRLSLVGHSMGGGIAVRVALEAPTRMTRLVLIAPTNLGGLRLIRFARPLLPAALRRIAPYIAVRPLFWVLLRAVYGDLSKPTRNDVDEYHAPSKDPAFARAQHSLLREYDWTPIDDGVLSQLQVPTLLIYGTRDRFVMRDGMERLVRLAPFVKTHIVAGAGHSLPEEAPALVNPLIVKFLLAQNSDLAARNSHSTTGARMDGRGT